MLDCRKLADARKAARLTQEQTAKAAGVSCRTYQRYESGTVDPGESVLVRLSEVLGVSPDELYLPDGREDAEIQALVDVILEKNGPQQQAIILIEEMSELTKVLCKIQRGKFSHGKLNEEFTHVRVSCEVIRRLMGIRSADVTAEVKAKLAEYA